MTSIDDDKADPDDESWATKDLELLHDAVRDELTVMNAFAGFDVANEALDVFAWAVTTRIEYMFDVTWAPNFARPGHPHAWHDNDGWHARCNDCLQESPPSASRQEAAEWFDIHYAASHPEQT